MKITKYNHLIPQNIATYDATNIGVYNGRGKKLGGFGLQNLRLPTLGEKQYSFGALSDVHITAETATTDLHEALRYLSIDSDASFACICGDLTDTGTETEFTTYKNIVDAYDIPVYAIAGNHEYYNTVSNAYLETYTGHPLYYTFTQGNDVFIMLGCYSWASDGIFTNEYLQWIYEVLEANRNKRCFIFEHVFPWGDCGNPNNVYGMDLFSGTKGDIFLSMLKHYKNTILFHGHSHTKFVMQEDDEKANFSNANGYRSIHIPSIAIPRDIVDGTLTQIFAQSEGYLIDVYKNHIVLRGRDFVKKQFIPIASYCIDTSLVNIEADTYVDFTGTIIT